MSAAQALTGETRKRESLAVPPGATEHWSLAPASWPGAETAVPYPARAWRTRARLQVLPAWREHLQLLSHHDPEYAYDPGCEYEEGWTTDAAYRKDGVRLYRFDGEGRLIMPHGSFHSRLIELMLQTLCLVLGRRVCREPDLRYPAWLSETLGQFTEGGEPRTLIAPDLAVMPLSWTLAEERERTVEERIIRVDRDAPAPELVVEMVSRSSADKDFQDNLSLYGALGIPEYLIVDTGEFKSEPNMWLFRLDETVGSYRGAESGRTLTACGVPMRLMDAAVAGNVPVFQCQDPETGQWHDHEGDIALRERIENHVKLLDRCLPSLDVAERNSLVAAWKLDGVPDDMITRLVDAGQDPDRWREILGLPKPTEMEGRSL